MKSHLLPLTITIVSAFSEFYIVAVDAFMGGNGVDYQKRVIDFCDLNHINTIGYISCFNANSSSCS